MAVSYILLLIPALFTRSLVAVTCYRPDSQPVNDPSTQPCNQAGGDTVSMCCSLNRTSYPDQCLSNGLCSGGGNVFRDSCTDKTWKSPLCLNLCTTGGGASGTAIGVSQETYLDYAKSDIQVTDCNDGSYCCGPDNTTCCSLGQGKHIASILTAPSSSSSMISTRSIGTTTTALSTSITPTNSPVPTANGSSDTATSSSSDASSSGLSKDAIVGIAVGCFIAAFFIGAAAVWYIFVRKRANSSGTAELGKPDPQELAAKHAIHEKPVPSAPAELWHQEPHVELDAAAMRTSRAESEG